MARRAARERQVGFVFQHYALFRHMTVVENVAFGLRVRPRARRGRRAARSRERVEELLALVQLDGLGERYPSQLSGGQRQRVALARALAIEPRVLLLDEPFGALDAKVRKELRRWLRDLHERLGLTTVFVTHDQEEALELADRVVVMNEGRIEQIGTPAAGLRPPGHALRLRLPRQRQPPALRRPGRADRRRRRPASQAPFGVGIADGPASLFVRPHDLAVEPADRAQGIAAALTSVMTTGPTYRLQLKLEQVDAEVEAEMAKSRFDTLGLAPEALVTLRPRVVRAVSRTRSMLQPIPIAEVDARLSAAVAYGRSGAPSIPQPPAAQRDHRVHAPRSAGSMWQAIRWPVPKVRIGGSAPRRSCRACAGSGSGTGSRGGGLTGEGISPSSTICFLSTEVSAIGTAESSASV